MSVALINLGLRRSLSKDAQTSKGKKDIPMQNSERDLKGNVPGNIPE